MRRVLEKMEGQIDLPAIQAALRNHETFPGAPDTYPEASCIEAVCSHVPHGSYDEDKVWKTISSSIYHLNAGEGLHLQGLPLRGNLCPIRGLNHRNTPGGACPAPPVLLSHLRGGAQIRLRPAAQEVDTYDGTCRL